MSHEHVQVYPVSTTRRKAPRTTPSPIRAPRRRPGHSNGVDKHPFAGGEGDFARGQRWRDAAFLSVFACQSQHQCFTSSSFKDHCMNIFNQFNLSLLEGKKNNVILLSRWRFLRRKKSEGNVPFFSSIHLFIFWWGSRGAFQHQVISLKK